MNFSSLRMIVALLHIMGSFHCANLHLSVTYLMVVMIGGEGCVMRRAMSLSVRRFRRNCNGVIPVSAHKAGTGVELSAPMMSLTALF